MPIYEYGCANCGNRVEVMHGVNDTGPGACSRCGGPMRKLLSAPAIVFKGSGWAKKERASQPATKSSSGEDASKAAEAPSEGATGKTDGGGSTKAADEGGAGSGSSDAA